MKLDAHAHRKSDSTQILVGVHTFGIHPWDLTLPYDPKETNKKWESLLQKTGTFYALGECGLDRVHEGIADIDEQKRVLEKHFKVAEERSLPMIIHSVRAYSDLLGMLKKNKFQQNIMLHAYGGNEQEMHELLKYSVYFSYGARLFNTDKMLKQTPLDKLLLESGDQDEYSIDDIYNKAAESLNIPVDELEKILLKNFLKFFSKYDDVSAANFIKDLDTRKSLS